MLGEKKEAMSIDPSIVKDGFGLILSSYLIALEGYRRGLVLEIHDAAFMRFSLSSENRKVSFTRSRVDKVTRKAVDITVLKSTTKRYMKKKNVPVPEGKVFHSKAENEEIIEYASALGYPVVLKPYKGSSGTGVVANIKSSEELEEALQHVRIELERQKVLIEKFIDGEDYRVYVVEDQVGGVIKRIPANVTGDGKNTIKQLIREKNRKRSENPHLSKGLITMDYEVKSRIEQAGYQPDSVLKKGEILFLREKASASAGGDTINVTDDFPEVHKQAAINAVASIPGLYNGGVDMMVNLETNQGVVLEINNRAQLGIHGYPAVGEGINIAAIMLDLYFPETLGEKKYAVEREALTFNLRQIIKPIEEGFATSVTAKEAPRGRIASRKILFKEKTGDPQLRKWIRDKALKMKLIGSLSETKKGNTKIILGGRDEDISVFEEELLKQPYQFNKFSSEEYPDLIRTGFEVKERPKAPKSAGFLSNFR